MTQKKFIINNCLECPAYESDCTCGIDDNMRYIADSSTFPPWCPLENA